MGLLDFDVNELSTRIFIATKFGVGYPPLETTPQPQQTPQANIESIIKDWRRVMSVARLRVPASHLVKIEERIGQVKGELCPILGSNSEGWIVQHDKGLEYGKLGGLPYPLDMVSLMVYEEFDQMTNPLGYPIDWRRFIISDGLGKEDSRATGTLQLFERGLIAGRKKFNTEGKIIDWTLFAVIGEIWKKYLLTGGAESTLGFPRSKVKKAHPSIAGTEGEYQRFDGPWSYPEWLYKRMGAIECGATIYYSESWGAHISSRGFGQYHEENHGTGGFLGFPKMDESDTAPSPSGKTGRYQQFEGGTLYWTEDFGVQPTMGSIEQQFHQRGGTKELGFPIRYEGEARDIQAQQFEDGWLYK